MADEKDTPDQQPVERMAGLPDSAAVVDLTAKPGDIRWECPTCGWGVTLKPEGEAGWTKNGTITPRCRRDRTDLVRTVL